MDNASPAANPALASEIPVKPEVAPVKKSKMPKLLIFLGAVELCLPLYIIFTIVPHFSNLVAEVSGSPNAFLLLLSLAALTGLIIAQIFYGVRLVKEQRGQNVLNPLQKKIAVILLLVGVIASILFIPAIISSIILPIYSITDTISK